VIKARSEQDTDEIIPTEGITFSTTAGHWQFAIRVDMETRQSTIDDIAIDINTTTTKI
jgi:hypothetical protein